MMDTAIIVALIAALASVTTTLLNMYNGRKRDTLEKNAKVLSELQESAKLEKGALQVLLRSDLLSQHEYYMERGAIRSDAMGRIEDEYKIYHELGANGVIDQHMKDLRDLRKKTAELARTR